MAAPMKAMGAMNGYGSGAGGLMAHGKAGMAMPVAPAPAPPPARTATRRAADRRAADQDEEKAEKKASKDDAARPATTSESGRAASAAWVVTASGGTAIGGTAPLVAAIRTALASGRAACLAASDLGKPIRIRLTVDARGRVVRVELVAGDRSAESCLRGALLGLSSATIASGARGESTGTVEIALRAR